MTHDQENSLVDEYAPGWKPEEGSVIIGQVIDLSRGWSDQRGDYYPIVTVQPDGQEAPVAIHCFHTALERRMKALRPVIGERIGIKYKGKVKTKDGKREVAVYIVRIQGRSEDIWGSDAPAAPERPHNNTELPATHVDTEDDIPF